MIPKRNNPKVQWSWSSMIQKCNNREVQWSWSQSTTIPKHNDPKAQRSQSTTYQKLKVPEVQQSRSATIPFPKCYNLNPKEQQSRSQSATVPKKWSQIRARNKIWHMSTRIHLENIQIATIPKYNNSNLPRKYLFKKCKILSSKFTPNLQHWPKKY